MKLLKQNLILSGTALVLFLLLLSLSSCVVTSSEAKTFESSTPVKHNSSTSTPPASTSPTPSVQALTRPIFSDVECAFQKIDGKPAMFLSFLDANGKPWTALVDTTRQPTATSEHSFYFLPELNVSFEDFLKKQKEQNLASHTVSDQFANQLNSSTDPRAWTSLAGACREELKRDIDDQIAILKQHLRDLQYEYGNGDPSRLRALCEHYQKQITSLKVQEGKDPLQQQQTTRLQDQLEACWDSLKDMELTLSKIRALENWEQQGKMLDAVGVFNQSLREGVQAIVDVKNQADLDRVHQDLQRNQAQQQALAQKIQQMAEALQNQQQNPANSALANAASSAFPESIPLDKPLTGPTPFEDPAPELDLNKLGEEDKSLGASSFQAPQPVAVPPNSPAAKAAQGAAGGGAPIGGGGGGGGDSGGSLFKPLPLTPQQPFVPAWLRVDKETPQMVQIQDVPIGGKSGGGGGTPTSTPAADTPKLNPTPPGLLDTKSLASWGGLDELLRRVARAYDLNRSFLTGGVLDPVLKDPTPR